MKMAWVGKHIDSLELIAGFPGLYLEQHAEALKMMVMFWKKSKNFLKDILKYGMCSKKFLIKGPSTYSIAIKGSPEVLTPPSRSRAMFG